MAVIDLPRAPAVGIATEPVPRCPACDSSRRHARGHVAEHEYTTTTTDRFPLMECDACGAWYLDPRPHASALPIIYPPNYYAYVRDTRTEAGSRVDNAGLFSRLGAALFKRRIRPIAKHIDLGPDKTWLDIGCGSGSGLQAMKEAYGVEGSGLDLSAQAAERCQRRGFRAFAGRFEDYVPAAGEAYDLVHSSHLIEHVESPYAYLRKTWDLLKPGGLSVFVTPNTATWEARAFGRHWGGLHAPRHWTLLNPGSVRALAARAGFEHVETCFSTNGTFWTWTFHSLLRGRVGTSVNDAVFPSDERFIRNTLWNIARIGAFAALDTINRVCTGQSANMLVILRKPALAAGEGAAKIFGIDELRRLSRVSNARGAVDFAAAWGVIFAALLLAHRSGRWWAYAAAAIVVGSRQSALANLAHDAWHGLCFLPRSLNNWVGAWLYAYPVGIPFHHDRRRHLRHHKRVGFRDDPDWVNYSNDARETPGRLIRFLAGRLLGSLLVSTVWSVLVQRRARIDVGDEIAELPVRAEWLRIAATQAVLFAAATLWLGVWAYPLLWLVPLSTVAAFCTCVRAFVEHSTEDDAGDEQTTTEERLRDYSPGPVEAAWFSPCHFHFHALHHAYPSIPHYRLPSAKATATATAGRYPFAVAPGYLRSLGARLGRR